MKNPTDGDIGCDLLEALVEFPDPDAVGECIIHLRQVAKGLEEEAEVGAYTREEWNLSKIELALAKLEKP